LKRGEKGTGKLLHWRCLTPCIRKARKLKRPELVPAQPPTQKNTKKKKKKKTDKGRQALLLSS